MNPSQEKVFSGNSVTHDSICFEKYLELFSQKFPEDLHIIQLDNGSPHQAFELDIPENIILLFQPPYSPQVNPIERFWKHLRKDLGRQYGLASEEAAALAIARRGRKLSERLPGTITTYLDVKSGKQVWSLLESTK